MAVKKVITKMSDGLKSDVKKKVVKKTIVKKLTKEEQKNDKVPIVEKKMKNSFYQYFHDLIIQRKYTDEEIVEQFRKQYSDCKNDNKLVLKQISAVRYFMNAGKRKGYNPEGQDKLERLVIVDGNKIPISKKVVMNRTNKKHFYKNPDDDPLNKFDLNDNKKNQKKKVVKKKASKKK